jgi:hypothetical protein
MPAAGGQRSMLIAEEVAPEFSNDRPAKDDSASCSPDEDLEGVHKVKADTKSWVRELARRPSLQGLRPFSLWDRRAFENPPQGF